MKVLSVELPETNISPVEWFIKNNVSTNIMSLDSGVTRFIDSLERNY